MCFIRSWRRHTLLARSSQRIPVGSERPDRGAGLYSPAGAVPGAPGLLPGRILQQDVRHYSATGKHIPSLIKLLDLLAINKTVVENSRTA